MTAPGVAREGMPTHEGDMSIEAVFARIKSGAIKELNLIVKADVQGSVEPIVNSLEKLGDQAETRAKVIHAGLGNVNITNVNLAVASKAMIIAFNVKVEDEARRVAEFNGVTIREYNVIYTLIEEIENMLTGMLEPRYQEVIHGHALVRQTFKAGRRNIAGCVVTDGVIHRRDRVRVRRGTQQIWEGSMASLRRVKDDVNEVPKGSSAAFCSTAGMISKQTTRWRCTPASASNVSRPCHRVVSNESIICFVRSSPSS